MTDLKRHIRDIPDFPKPGIVFKDITPLLADRDAFRATIERFIETYRGRVDVVLGIESRYWRAIGAVESLVAKAQAMGQRWLKGVGAGAMKASAG